MENGVEVRRGDVFWLLYNSGTDSYVETAKRPIIIVSSDKGNETSPCVLGVPTTTKPKFGVICPEITSSYKQCWAVCNQVGCFDKARLGEYMYSLSDDDMAAVDRGLCVVMSLEPATQEENREEEIREYEEEIASLRSKVADLTNQVNQQKLNRVVETKLYERAIEEIVSLRMSADIEKATIKRTKQEKAAVAEPKKVVAEIEGKVVGEDIKPEINTCSEAELKACGCNPTQIHHIIANRPYMSVEDLKTVPGITRIAYQILEGKVRCVPVAKPKKEVVAGKGKVNVNTATVDEMVEVAGMNLTLCNFIRAYRNKHGKFERVEDLLNVKRFGSGCLKKYGPMLEV